MRMVIEVEAEDANDLLGTMIRVATYIRVLTEFTEKMGYDDRVLQSWADRLTPKGRGSDRLPRTRVTFESGPRETALETEAQGG